MNAAQHKALALRETDIDGALRRMSENVKLYEDCLHFFPEDTTMKQLNAAVTNSAWDEAFTAAHALKGMAGNMGFVPLMHNTGQLVIQLRGGHMKEIPAAMQLVNNTYRDILDGIHQYFVYANEKGEENDDESK
ncbi:MAG: Hpt domain-containing protein [Eubacteriales bacterium]|nr:Hpt domain-containing protein [Eubacteriales bacterium]